MRLRPNALWFFSITGAILLFWCAKVYAPNDKVGPRFVNGSGAADEPEIEVEDKLSYVIRFENFPIARHAVRSVEIVDRLDPKLDLSTFRCCAVGIGSAVLEVTGPPRPSASAMAVDFVEEHLWQLDDRLVKVKIVLDTATREARWLFTTLDPDTELPPEDRSMGFLPPNKLPPQGEGFVSFTIRPSSDFLKAKNREGEHKTEGSRTPEGTPVTISETPTGSEKGDARGSAALPTKPGGDKPVAASKGSSRNKDGGKLREGALFEVATEDNLKTQESPGAALSGDDDILNSGLIRFDDEPIPVRTNNVRTRIIVPPSKK